MIVLLMITTLTTSPGLVDAQDTNQLTALRQMRRISLTLLDQQPAIAQYEALLQQPESEREAYLNTLIDSWLDSEAFAEALVLWGHEYLRVSSFDQRVDSGRWTAARAIQLDACPDDTLHAGAVGTFSDFSRLDDPTICDDPNANISMVEPWWESGTQIAVVGSAGLETRELNGEDCGIADLLQFSVFYANDGCSCGPNLIYCSRRGLSPYHERGYDGSNHDLTAQRRSAFDEPARLLSHIIMNDRPFTDLILGDYTVVNQGLYHLYQRAARQNMDNDWLDDNLWWRNWSNDPAVWREVTFSELHPNLIDDRSYTFDPRTDDGAPIGVPSAGILTTLAANASFTRERVRAARWLEQLTCRDFSPPPADVVYDPYERDPGTEGVCQHCHQIIDPAAIHFKRIFDGGGYIAGVVPWRISDLVSYSPTRLRLENAYIHDTLMTPVSENRINSHPDSRLIDFLPQDTTLLGQTSDGTIGPLGFAKLIIASGDFDRCAVMRTYERFGGRALIRGKDEALIQKLLTQYLGEGRNVRALIRFIVSQPTFRQGW